MERCTLWVDCHHWGGYGCKSTYILQTSGRKFTIYIYILRQTVSYSGSVGWWPTNEQCQGAQCRASRLMGHKIGRSSYLMKTQSGYFYGNFSGRRNSPQQPLSCDYYIKTFSVNRTSVTHWYKIRYKWSRKKQDESPDFTTIQLLLYCSFNPTRDIVRFALL